MNLRRLLILEAVFSLITGLTLLVLPGWTLDLYGLETDATGLFMTQTAAGLYIGVGLLAWLCRNVTQRDLARSLTAMYIVYHAVLLVVALIAWLGSDFDFDLGWVSVLIEVVFAVAFAVVRWRDPVVLAGGRS